MLKMSMNQVQFCVVANCEHSRINILSMQCLHKLEVFFLLQLKHQVSMKEKWRVLHRLCWDKKIL